MSPTARTLDYLRELGGHAEVVERFNSFTKQRKDMFGFADIIHFDRLNTSLWQVTSTAHVNERLAKVLASPLAKDWISTDRHIYVMGWKKYAKPVDRKLWRPTIIKVTPEMFDGPS